MNSHQDSPYSHLASPESTELFVSLPSEIRSLFFVEPFNLSLMLEFRLTNKQTMSTLDEYFSNLPIFMAIMRKLSPIDARKFCNYFRTTNRYKEIEAQASADFSKLTPDEMICFALATDDVKKIDPELLSNAIKQSKKAFQETILYKKLEGKFKELQEKYKELEKQLPPENERRILAGFDDGVDQDIPLVKQMKSIEREMDFLRLEREYIFNTYANLEATTLILSPKKFSEIIRNWERLTAPIPETYFSLNDKPSEIDKKLAQLSEKVEEDMVSKFMPNQYKKEPTPKFLNFSGANLTGDKIFITREFPGEDIIAITPLDLSTVNFAKAELQGTRFLSTKLDGASFREASAEKAVFSGSHLYNVNFTKTLLNSANFSPSDACCTPMVSIHMEYHYPTELTSINFTEADLRNANFTEAHIVAANFSGAKLEGANFTKATLSSPIFVDTDLNGVNFDNVQFTGVIANANFTGATLVGTFKNATLENVNLSTVDLGRIKFEGDRTKLNKVKIIGNITFETLSSKLTEKVANINQHPSAAVLRAAMVEEIIGYAITLPKNQALQLLDIAINHPAFGAREGARKLSSTLGFTSFANSLGFSGLDSSSVQALKEAKQSIEKGRQVQRVVPPPKT